MDCGVVQCVGELRSTGGRRREVLKLNSEAGFFVVLDLEGTRIRVGLTNFIGDVRFRWEEEVNSRRRLEIRDILKGIRSVRDSLDATERLRVLAVGVSYTGMLDDDASITAVNLGWKAFPLAQQLGRFIDLPIFYANDGVCKILAERWLGVAQNSGNCVYVMAGVGLGIGCYFDGHLIRGEQGLAGEFGHMTIDPNAPDRCNCGKTGCLEAIASSPNIVRQYLEKTGRAGQDAKSYPVSEVFGRARENDPAARAIVERVGHYLGFGLSHIVNLLNPSLIVLGGDLIAGQDLLMPLIRQELDRHCLPKLTERLELKVGALGLDSGLKGAASLAFDHTLQDDELLKKMTSPIQFQPRGLQHEGAATEGMHSNRSKPAAGERQKRTIHGKTGNTRRL